MIFCLMQNAYAFHLHRLPFEKLLLSGRWWYPHSRAGARLRILLPEIWCPEYVYFFNTTWKVGLKASDKYPPDFDYVRKWVDKLTPDVVVATGKQAEEVATEVWSGSLVVTPHPTYRCLTNRLYRLSLIHI